MLRVLIIGFVPKEFGGSYTTGACNVVYELSKHSFIDIEECVVVTNSPRNLMDKKKYGNNTFYGYKIRPLVVLGRILRNPIETIKQWVIYKRNSRVGIIKNEFYKNHFIDAIKYFKPDIIHCHGPAQLMSLYFANQNYGIPIIQTFHGLFTEHKLIFDKPLFTYATGLTDETVQKIIAKGISKDVIYKIPNGVDTNEIFYSDVERQKLRLRYSVKGNQNVFITVASISERKGQLKFVQLLEQSTLDYQYWIVGTGKDAAMIQEYCDSHKLQDKVKLVGYVKHNELYKYYSAADIYAHCSTAEGQSLSEMEAYTTGMKIALRNLLLGTVTTNVNSNNYYVYDNDNVDYESFEFWARNNNNVRDCSNHLDWSFIAAKYADCYRDVYKRTQNSEK